MKRALVVVSIAFVLASLCVASVQAKSTTYHIEPTKEATESIVLDVSDSAVGNVSIDNGLIDFYVTNPSGHSILRYNSTTFELFNFTAVEKGAYTMHFANANQEGNVTVLLSYCVNFTITVHENINVGTSTGVANVLGSPVLPVPFDWTWLIQTFASLLLPIGKALGALRKYLKDRGWEKKYKGIVVIKPL
jgi:hypothetical protein